MGEFIGETTILELSQRLGRAPNASELAAELRMDRDDIIAMLLTDRRTPATAPRSVARPDTTRSGKTVDVYLRVHRTTDGDRLRPLLAALPERQLAVMLMRFGVPLSQTQIAAVTGMARTEVFRLLATSLASLREMMRGENR